MLQPIKKTPTAVRNLAYAAALILTAHFASAQVAAPGTAPIQSSTAAALAPAALPTYDNKWDFYGGLAYMNGQAGQNLPKHYNMGGVELQATYWLGSPKSSSVLGRHLGVTGEFRGGAGTTPLSPNQYNLNRVVVYQEIGAGGASWRGPHNRYAGIDFHALAGVTHGVFDNAIINYPPGNQGVLPPTTNSVGLYSNRTAGWGAAGGSIDFNYSPKIAVRLSPDIVFEHFGTETREFFSISLGGMYRFGKK